MILGLTGDVGAGKSTLCRVWKDMGAYVIDSDSLAKNLWNLKTIQKKAKIRWGDDFFSCPSSEMSKKIADKIFNDDEEYKFVSELLHKATISRLKKIAEKSDAKWIVVEIPLLFECGVPEWIDKTVYVSASLGKRVERNAIRGWNELELSRREDKLLPREEKMKKADWIIENSGTLKEWEEKGYEFALKILSLTRLVR
ncbi:MAG: dephospho-CoA kinase [Synergistaceae bacterium]